VNEGKVKQVKINSSIGKLLGKRQREKEVHAKESRSSFSSTNMAVPHCGCSECVQMRRLQQQNPGTYIKADELGNVICEPLSEGLFETEGLVPTEGEGEQLASETI